jgi:hypothetical protein
MVVASYHLILETAEHLCNSRGVKRPPLVDKRVVLVISNLHSTKLGAVPMAVRLGLMW